MIFYCIMWGSGIHSLLGDSVSVLAVAYMLEKLLLFFSVSSIKVGFVRPEHFGLPMDSFKFWFNNRQASLNH